LKKYIAEIKNIVGADRVVENALMSKYTTFRIGGEASALVEINSESDLVDTLKYIKCKNLPFFTIGNGSNLLVSDAGIEGIVVRLGSAFSSIAEPYIPAEGYIEATGINSDKFKQYNRLRAITAHSGASLSSLANEALRLGLGDMAGLAGIPGTLGGAVYMNAGAYGYEVCQLLAEVKVYDIEKDDVYSIVNKNIKFSYRHSRFIDEENLIILSTTWLVEELDTSDKQDLEEKYKDLANKRRASQPLELPSAGSFFKRPKNGFAAALIEQAGLKGTRIGGASVSEKHSGFIVNDNNASFNDVIKLADLVRDKVKLSSGVALETEPKVVEADYFA
jgi:UDP-N-acetylmuramate dehydrogenase